MSDPHGLLQTLAIVLSLAALMTMICRRLKQPVVFGYLLAGMIAGPNIPIPLVADAVTVRTLSELGVILLMFSLGLEFSLRKVMRIAPKAGIVALVQAALMMLLGYAVAQALGWSRMESIFAGAAISVSSTTVIAKAFEEQRTRGRFTELVLGVLIMEDLIAIVLVAVLTAVSVGSKVTLTSVGVTGLRLASFVAMLIVGGLFIVPRLIRAVVKINRPETTLIVSVGICFAVSLLALKFGYSVALGAFIAGSLIAESGQEKIVETLVQPVRDMFAAIFFVSVGMIFDPKVIVEHWPSVLAFTAVVVVGNVVIVSLASFLTGYGTRTSLQAGMSLAQIGEFSFIIAGVGLAAGATRNVVYQMAVTVAAITTLTTPWLIRGATPMAAWVDRKLPHPVQTFAALYGSWIERVRSAPSEPARRTRVRQLIELLLVDAALIAAVIIGAAVEMTRFTRLMRGWTGAPDNVARLIVLAAAAAIGGPLLIGLVRVARMLGLELATRAMPLVAKGKVDLAAAPRGALAVSLQLAVLTAIVVPLMALTHPFVPASRTGVVFVTMLAAVAVAFWRSASELQGHARAGAEVIAGALARQMATTAPEGPKEMRHTMEQMIDVLAGLGEPEPMRIAPNSPAARKSLTELNLRGLTGATVLAIMRDGEQIPAPSGKEKLREGDVIAVAGSTDAIEAVRELLAAPVPEEATEKSSRAAS